MAKHTKNMKNKGTKRNKKNQFAPIREATDNTREEMSKKKFTKYMVNLDL